MRAVLPSCALLVLASCAPRHDPEALAAPPTQAPTDRAPFEVTRGDLRLRVKPRATYAVRGLVLDDSRWLLDRWEDVSPLDLTLGWGPAVRPEVLAELDLVTENRFATWTCDAPGVTRRELQASIANHHLVPADAAVEDALDEVGEGDVVYLEGLLVDVDVLGPGGAIERRYRTSLTRADEGATACELLWVEVVRAGRSAEVPSPP